MTDPFAGRSAQDLVRERGANASELRGETDKTARKMLEQHIAAIDRELASRRTVTP